MLLNYESIQNHYFCLFLSLTIFLQAHEYLIRQNTAFVKFTKGSIKKPGTFTFTDTVWIRKRTDYCYKGKIVILINEFSLKTIKNLSLRENSIF